MSLKLLKSLFLYGYFIFLPIFISFYFEKVIMSIEESGVRKANIVSQSFFKDNLISPEKITHTSYKKGETIFKEGTNPFGIFYLKKGKIKLVKTGDDGREHILRLNREGDLVGYRSLFSDSGYNASAICVEDSELTFVPRDTLIEAVHNNKDLSFQIIQMLAEDLRRADLHLTSLAQKPVRERVAEALIFIKETYGFEEDGKTLQAQFSREEIANIVGTATENTIRVLSDFKKEGLVILDKKKISIPDLPNLEKIANGGYL